MALKEAYTSQALAPLLGLTRQGVDAQAKSGGWQFRPRKGRGGGKEWLVSSMPEATQRALQTAEDDARRQKSPWGSVITCAT